MLIILVLGCVPPAAPAAESGDGQGFDAFGILLQRNIFNPDRRKLVPESRRPPPAPLPPRVESITLTGLLIYQDQKMAFFNGSEARYETVVKPGGEIGGHKLLGLTNDHADLEVEGNPVRLDIGASLQKRGDEPWECVEEEVGDGGSWARETNAGKTADSNGGTADAAAGDAGEILKRLMEKRRKEMEQ